MDRHGLRSRGWALLCQTPDFNPDGLLRRADEREAERGDQSDGGDAYQEIPRWRQEATMPRLKALA